jgi:hypothetical protein
MNSGIGGVSRGWVGSGLRDRTMIDGSGRRIGTRERASRCNARPRIVGRTVQDRTGQDLTGKAGLGHGSRSGTARDGEIERGAFVDEVSGRRIRKDAP